MCVCIYIYIIKLTKILQFSFFISLFLVVMTEFTTLMFGLLCS